MLSTQTAAAVQAAQAQAVATADSYQLDVNLRALDELVRHPANNRPAAHQVRSARANAAKVVRTRRQAYEDVILRNRPVRPGVQRSERFVEAADTSIDTLDWLSRTTSLTDGQRHDLLDLAAGGDAGSIAAREDLPVARVRERISRARRAGRVAYQREVAG